MFNRLKYKLALSKLNREYGKIQKEYDKLKVKAKGEEWQMLHSEEGSLVVPILEKIELLKTRNFCRIADLLLVPLPDRSNKEFWEDLHYEYGRYLTDKGIWEVKKYIREEKRQRRECFLCWITPLTGIIGVLIGLVAVLKR